MSSIWGRLKDTKTLKAALAGILGAVAAGLGGQLPWTEVIQVVFLGLVSLCLRDGMAKGSSLVVRQVESSEQKTQE